MAQGSRCLSNCRDGCDGTPLLSMGHAVLGTRALGDLKHPRACRPDRDYSLALTHLDLFACQLQRRWQPIEDTIVGDVAIPGHLALFGGKALPGKVLCERQQLLLGQTIYPASGGGAMNAGVDALAPGVGLAVETVQFGHGVAAP